MKKTIPGISVVLMSLWLLVSCSANNCPLESTVTCNYGFYDRDGKAVTYGDAITVSTLLPGTKTQYTYRRLGEVTVVSDTERADLVDAGYTETISTVRNDTVLANQLTNASTMKLPMKYYSESDTLILSYASISRKDTLYIAHESYTHVELPECGSHRFHHLKQIRNTDAAIDHTEIVEPEVNYKGLENIRIYFNGSAE